MTRVGLVEFPVGLMLDGGGEGQTDTGLACSPNTFRANVIISLFWVGLVDTLVVRAFTSNPITIERL